MNKLGQRGILPLAFLGGLAFAMAIIGPLFFREGGVLAGNDGEKAAKGWQLAAKGMVESKQEVHLASQIKGLIKEFAVDEGDSVKAGQVVVKFDSSKAAAHLAMAEASQRQAAARLAEAEHGYRSEDIEAAQMAFERSRTVADELQNEAGRMNRLHDSGAVTRFARDEAVKNRDVALADMREAAARLQKMEKGPRNEEIAAAKAELARARAEVRLMNAHLDDCSATSPIDGLVIERAIEVGESVDVGTPLLTIIDPRQLRIWAELEETDVGKVKIGQAVAVTADAFQGRVLNGKVTQVFDAVQRKRQKSFDPVASFDINTQKIYIALDDYAGLVHGMTVTVKFMP